MKKLINWLDKNIIKILLIGYVFFIPLWPKLPFKMIDYTYIALRLEDFYVVIISTVFLIQLLRKKETVNRKFLILFMIFWGAVFLSYLWGYFVQKTIVFWHLGLLHSLRRIEYMTIFFIACSSIRSKKDFHFYLRFIMMALLLVTIYGIGQKYLGWPAVQTMNPEYAKGYILVLDANARISSTFGGHYDLAAYLIFLIPIILSFYLYTKNFTYFLLFVLSLANLVLTASRVSYIAYLLSIVPFLLFVRKFRLLIVVLILTGILTLLSNNLTKRLTRTFQTKQVFIDKYSGQTTVPRRMSPDDLPVGDFIPINIKKQTNDGKTVEINQDIGIQASSNLNTKDAIQAKSQIREEIRKKARLTGKKMTIEEENALVEEAFRNMRVVTAVLPDISVATRLQVEWPRAIRAFLKNPILGKGPSAITEATDNDYLRWLGEFGLLGTISFIVIIFSLMKSIWLKIKQLPQSEKIFMQSLLFSLVGLLINAAYIDVFEASKVAYIFWLIIGFYMGLIELKHYSHGKKSLEA